MKKTFRCAWSFAYYNREQYGSNPLFYGPQYTEGFAGLDKDNPSWQSSNYERNYKTGMRL
jgi:hypothetical protein